MIPARFARWMSSLPAQPGSNVVGNVYDKYGSKNPIARRLMDGFLENVGDMYEKTAASTVLEVGCGEGRLADYLFRRRPPTAFVALDLSMERLAPELDPRVRFLQASAYELPFADDAFDLVVCCEVLEHLDRPAEALRELTRVSRSGVLMSTPREPLWRAMNVARGKYLRDLGNTPGHIQAFSRRSLKALASAHLEVEEVRSPIPWTAILGKVGGSSADR